MPLGRALTPDERRFIFLRTKGVTAAVSATPPEVIQVDNWLHELRAAGTWVP